MSSDGSHHGGGSPSGSSAAAPAAGSSGGFDAAASQSMPDPMIGQVLDGRYRITKKLGEGGMGEVYAAEHAHIEKRVAVKLLRPEIVQNEEAASRFRQEARSASSIGHRNIAGIEDFGKLADGRLYLCMELLDGAPLNELIEQPMAPDRLLNILIQTGHGLAAAHKKNIVHRDMKPENIFVTFTPEGDVPKLLDFGIAKVSQSEGNNHLTKTGTIFGTPFYMAPEQALGQGVDARADVYAMGVIMYECYTGVVPFQGESFMAILTQHITSEAPSPSATAAANGRTIPYGVEEIIVKAMKKEPADRYQSMDEFVQVLVNAYRSVAGAGMSTYMQAHVPAPTAAFQVPNQGPGSAVYPSVSPHPTPPPYQQQSGPYAHSAGASDSMFEMPKKSRAGLFIAIFAVLGVVGGGAAFLLMSGKDKQDEVAAGDPDDGTVVPDGTTVQPKGTQPDPVKGTATDPDKPPVTGPEVVVDPNNDDPDPDEPLVDHGWGPGVEVDPNLAKDPDPVPEAKPVNVLVNSSPQGAYVYLDGKKQKNKTPLILPVKPGEIVSIVLKRSGYLDETVAIDGKQTRVTASLSRKKADPKKPDPKPKDPDPKKPDPKFDPNKLEEGVLGG